VGEDYKFIWSSPWVDVPSFSPVTDGSAIESWEKERWPGGIERNVVDL